MVKSNANHIWFVISKEFPFQLTIMWSLIYHIKSKNAELYGNLCKVSQEIIKETMLIDLLMDDGVICQANCYFGLVTKAGVAPLQKSDSKLAAQYHKSRWFKSRAESDKYHSDSAMRALIPLFHLTTAVHHSI